MTELNKNILKEREAQYGSFELNLRLIEVLNKDNFIKLNIGEKLTDNNIDLIARANSDFNFVRYMLALKTARSLTASGDSFADCFIDFQNYIKLYIDLYRNNIPDVEILFNNDFFRFRKHTDFLAVNDCVTDSNTTGTILNNTYIQRYIEAYKESMPNVDFSKLRRPTKLNITNMVIIEAINNIYSLALGNKRQNLKLKQEIALNMIKLL